MAGYKRKAHEKAQTYVLGMGSTKQEGPLTCDGSNQTYQWPQYTLWAPPFPLFLFFFSYKKELFPIKSTSTVVKCQCHTNKIKNKILPNNNNNGNLFIYIT